MQLQLEYVPPPKELEKALASRFIMTMAASSPDQPVIKLFLYAQHVSPDHPVHTPYPGLFPGQVPTSDLARIVMVLLHGCSKSLGPGGEAWGRGLTDQYLWMDLCVALFPGSTARHFLQSV